MNKIILCGRLVKNPEMKKTPNDVYVTNFTIAVPRNNASKEVDYFDCLAWKSTAEFIDKWFEKGKPILIDGRVQRRTYKDKKENTKTVYEVIVNNAEFVLGEPKAKTEDFDDIQF